MSQFNVDSVQFNNSFDTAELMNYKQIQLFIQQKTTVIIHLNSFQFVFIQ